MFNKNYDKYSIHILILLWLLFFLLHLYFYGIVINLEAEKYIHEAQNIINKKGFSAIRFWFYSSTIFIIIVALKLKIGFTGAVIFQSAFNLSALLFFYKSIYYIFNRSSLIPFIIICVAILFSPYSSWNVFLYTESIFYSSILFLTATIVNHNYNKTNSGIYAIIIALTIAILSRPLGVLFIPAVIFYFYIGLSKKLKFIIIPITAIGIIILIYIINIIFTTTSDTTIILSAKQQCVVCGILPYSNAKLILLKEGSQGAQLYYYISHNFSNFASLALQRSYAFFFMIRSYYSTQHNILLLAFIIPIYTLSIISFFLKKEKIYKPIFYFMLISITTFALAIMLQCDDYHNRFILGLFPFFLIFSATTIAYKK